MASKHIETKRKIKDIAEIQTFNDLMDRIILSDTEKRIMQMIYIQNHNFCFIADELKLSEATVKLKHKKILLKIAKIF